MDKNLAREFKYRLNKGNLSLHVWNQLKESFNPNLPIRPSNKWSPSQINDLKLDLQIFLNQFELLKKLAASYSEAQEYLTLFLNWTEDNNDSTVKSMKDIEKKVRLSNFPTEVQSVLTFHRSYDFCPSKEEQNRIKIDYIDQFMSDLKEECLDYHFHQDVIVKLGMNLLHNLKYRILNGIKYHPPSCSNAMSPIGKKQYDIRCIENIVRTTPLIPEVYETYSQINKLMVELNLKPFNLIKAEGDVTPEQFLMNVKLLPKLNMIPNPGKMRPVFMSNDLYDVILDPFRVIVELCYKGLPCSYSSKKISNDNYLNIDIPDNVRRCQENSREKFDSGLVNSDLSSATDRMFYKFQENIIKDIFSLVYDEDKRIIADYFNIKDLDGYINLAFRLLSHSYISYDYINSRGKQVIGLRVPKYGQCQGQRGSFALLNITHICVNMQAMIDSGYQISLDSFLVNGDDGVLPQSIVDSYNRIWIINSAEGIKSADKSSDTEQDHVEFCKQYVVDKYKPQPLNGLRYKSYIKIIQDPTMIMILKVKFARTDFYNSFIKLKNRLSGYDSDYEYSGYVTVQITDDLELRFKLYSIINELRAKYLISLCNNPAVKNLFRDLIDDSDSELNVFDREKWIPDSEFSSAEEWLTHYGPLPLINKYNLEIQGLHSFDINEAIDFIVKNKKIPLEIVSIGKYDTEKYQSLVSLITAKKQSVLLESDFVRRTSNLQIHVEVSKVVPHSLLISTDIVDVSQRRDVKDITSH